MSEKEIIEDLPLEVRDKMLYKIDKIVDKSIWYKLEPFYSYDSIDRISKLEDFYFNNYLESHREKIVRIFIQISLSYDCFIEDESLYPDKIDPRMEDYDYVHIEDMDIDYLANLIRNIEPCGEYCCTRFYFWEIDSVIEINSLKSIFVFTESKEFLNLIEKLATAEGLYLYEEHYSVENNKKLNELLDKYVRDDDISSTDDEDEQGLAKYNLKMIESAIKKTTKEENSG
ncbi:MAG: hypothetical protein PUI80_02130 [Peptoniphilaceae bacterium]|nr:hypothetical protein [Peptoniphilaceae bacterium]